jgi:putative flippase GtrA
MATFEAGYMFLTKIYKRIKGSKLLSDFFTHKSLAQFGRYLIVGFSTVGLEIIDIRILTKYIGLWYLYSNTIAYTISFIFNFFLNRNWSFKSKGNLAYQLATYGILFFINLFLSNAMMYLFTSVFNIYYMISKVISIGVIVMWNFVLYKKIIYKEKPAET